MRKVTVAYKVTRKIADLNLFLHREYKMSRGAANSRTRRMQRFVASFANPADYAVCRYRPWRELGYHCAAFEGWVFAYEIFPDGVIVRDMAHGKALDEA